MSKQQSKLDKASLQFNAKENAKPVEKKSAKKIKKHFALREDTIEIIQQAEYWDRYSSMSEVVQTALDKFFEGKKYEPIKK